MALHSLPGQDRRWTDLHPQCLNLFRLLVLQALQLQDVVQLFRRREESRHPPRRVAGAADELSQRAHCRHCYRLGRSQRAELQRGLKLQGSGTGSVDMQNCPSSCYDPLNTSISGL